MLSVTSTKETNLVRHGSCTPCYTILSIQNLNFEQNLTVFFFVLNFPCRLECFCDARDTDHAIPGTSTREPTQFCVYSRCLWRRRCREFSCTNRIGQSPTFIHSSVTWSEINFVTHLQICTSLCSALKLYRASKHEIRQVIPFFFALANTGWWKFTSVSE